ncbi:MAG: N-acetylmuramoyl-L-alanine amidase [Proteobacteria bacterium]|nr:N-acetylmuramoyl-L-alanine amidase [Pseudomonadota bacterium]MBU1709543.1 N-acetylmuramoyl-L-alanine amidase [Pseudomonadota bacterium]
MTQPVISLQSRLLCLLIPLLAACILLADPATSTAKDNLSQQYRQAKSSFNKLVKDTKQSRSRVEWLQGIHNFRQVYLADPDDQHAPSSLFMMARMYRTMYSWSNNPLDLGEALAYYEDVASLFSGHRLADDSLYAVGEIYLDDKKDSDHAARVFAKIVALYPDGDMAQTAAAQLKKLQPSTRQNLSADEMLQMLDSSSKISPSGVEKASLQPLRFWSNEDYTRVVIETTSPVVFKDYMLNKDQNHSKRLFIDLENCQIPDNFQATVPIQDGLIQQARSSQYSADNVRVVLDAQSIGDYKIFSLKEPFRVVIDVRGTKKVEKENQEKIQSTQPLSIARQLGLGINRVIIDPGHGGKDCGAISPSGLKEKDVVLKIAKKVAGFLKSEIGSEVVLTRDSDIFVPLEERTAIANSRNGDLFISIHVNAAPSSDVKGIETYFLDLTSNAEAMKLAARENATSAGQMSNLQAILMDLIQNSKIQESAKLAEYIQDNMVTGLNSHYPNITNLGVKRAPFIVLVGAQMPSILVEISFLSNPEEEKRLKSDKYLSTVAENIVSGINQYVTHLNMANLMLK